MSPVARSSPSRGSEAPHATPEFGATWIIASLASCATAGAHTLGYFDSTVADSASGELIARRTGRSVGHPVTTSDGAVGFTIGGRTWLANVTSGAITVANTTLVAGGWAEVAAADLA